MQHEHEPVQSATVTTVTIVPALMEDVSVQRQDAELAEWIACIDAGIARIKKRAYTVQRSRVLYNIPWFLLGQVAGLVAARHWQTDGKAIIAAYLSATLVGWWLEREVKKIVSSRWVRRFRPAERDAIQRIVDRADLRGVGSMIDTLQWTDDTELNPQLWSALGQLLPLMSEDQVQILGQERYGAVATWMKVWDKRSQEFGNTPLLGMLHVLGCVGEPSVQTVEVSGVTKKLMLLPILNQWIAGKGAGQDPSVQKAATACRDTIEQKIALARSGEQLLRASAPASGGEESLLRPAHGTQQADPQELLRPGDPQ